MKPADAAAECGRVVRSRADPSFEVQQFQVGCVVRLSHRLSSLAQRRADAMALCAGHKKARSDPPGRDTHSYDDGPNTQDSVTQVNAFPASSPAPAGTIIAIRTNWNTHELEYARTAICTRRDTNSLRFARCGHDGGAGASQLPVLLDRPE